jgi:two-component system OmpR family sensor kinase
VSLRLRLLLALVALVAVGLLVADAVTYASLRSFLLAKVDQQLEDARGPVVRALLQSGGGPSVPGVPPGGAANLPPGTYGALVDSSGKVVAATAFTYGGESVAAPRLPGDLIQLAAADPEGATLTAGATGSKLTYRVLAWTPQGSSYTVVVAIPLSDLSQTLGRLVLVEALVTLGVLLGLGGLAWWIVRRELRPLEDMAVTAGAIAAGDLTRRVEPAEPRTEVGRLGLALNAMLAQIEQAFARRKASEDALRHFLAQASHELRTPLASIRGYAELFRRGAKDRPEDLELAMRRIEQEGARMGVLVDELLLLARLDEGRPLKREPVDLAEVAADTVADARVANPGRAIGLATSGPVALLGDEIRLRQVATNLVTNALIHAGEGAQVGVRTRSCDGWAELEVKDDGVGMSPEVAARVFEPFYHADGRRKEEAASAEQGSAGRGPDEEGRDGERADERARREAEAKGTTGLGLAIALGIAEAHGGSIELQTAPGRGASFVVRMPLEPPETVPEDGAPGAGAVADAAQAAPGSGS